MANKNLSESENLLNRLNQISINFDLNGEPIENTDFTIEFQECFKKLYFQSVKDNFYWQYCPVSVYKQTLECRKSQFLSKNIDAVEDDFWGDEMNELSNYLTTKKDIKKEIKNSDIPIDIKIKDGYTFSFKYNSQSYRLLIEHLLDKGTRKNIYFSHIRKMEFIISQRYDEQKNESNENSQTDKHELTKDITINDYPEIFKEGGYKVFCLLNEKYTKDNKATKAKYSNLYHFMDYEDLLNCTQKEYIAFIHNEHGVLLSKILPRTNKYNDTIKLLLKRYLNNQY